jgi:polysaccharide chain length determinant protein (PEP-CTERM system associated)
MLPGRKYTPDYILTLLWQGRRFLIIPAALGLVGALMVSRTYVPKYTADTLIQIIPQRVPDSFVKSTVTTNVDDRLKSIKQQIMSRTALERVVNEFDLYPDLRGQSVDKAVSAVRSGIAIEPVLDRPGRRMPNEQIDAFTVAFTYTDPAAAVRVTESLASRFIDENSRIRSSQAESTNEFLEAQLTELRGRLKTAEDKVKAFQIAHSTSLPTQQPANLQLLQSTQVQIQSLAQTLQADRDRRTMLESMLNAAVQEDAAAASAPAAPPPGAQPGALAGTARQQLEQARANLAQLELRLKPEHPDVARAKRQIRDLEAKAEAEARASGGGSAPTVPLSPLDQQRRERIRQYRADIAQLTSQIAFKENEDRRLRGLLAQYEGRIQAVPGLEAEYTALTRDYDALKTQYQQLNQRSEESKISRNLEVRQDAEQFRILDKAGVTGTPMSMARLQTNVGGLILGFVLGLAFLAANEVFRALFKSEADVVGALSLPVLAVVPYVASAREQAAAARRKRMLWMADAGVAVCCVTLVAVFQLWRYVA